MTTSTQPNASLGTASQSWRSEPSPTSPKSAPELVYTHSPRGFALISQRTETLQRMYFQCSPDDDTDAWSEDRIWAELQARVAGDPGALDEYGPRALARVWKAQHFSYWMTTMLHALPGASEFDLRRQLGELGSVAGSTAGYTYPAEAYTGWPSR